MKERRQEKRSQITYSLEVVNKLDNSILGTITDISTLGLLIKSAYQLHLDEYYTIMIKLPQNIDYQKSYIDIYIQPKWIKKEKNSFYKIGCQIIKINNDDRKLIESIINPLHREKK